MKIRKTVVVEVVGWDKAASAAGLAAFLLAALLPAAVRGAADLDEIEKQAFRAAVDRVAPSVVRIETIGGLEQVARMLAGTGPTTGLVVSADGYIVSSAFNFANKPDSILVQLADGARKPARLVATDHNRMLVLLKIDPPQPLTVPQWIPKGQVRVGQWAVAVGRAFESSRPSLAVGVISAVNRIWGKALQTDASISPNNYGGPLVDLRGRVFGLLVPLSPEGNDEAAGVEWYDSGIGFAIGADDLQAAVARLKAGKDLHSGVVGIRFATLGIQIAEPVISGSRPNSPASKAGLRKDDRIVEIEGRKIGRAVDIKEEISRRYAGETIHVKLLRGGKPVEAQMELVDKLEPYAHPFLGILPSRDLPAGTPEHPAGVKVRYVYKESPAAKAGLSAGDVLVSLAGQPVLDAVRLRRRITDFQPGDKIPFEFRRDQETRKATIELAGLPEAVPEGPLPPARGKSDAKAPAERPEVGSFTMQAGPLDSQARLYVPEDYEPAVAYGLVVWLHGEGGLKQQELVARWKPHCDRDRLILLAPKSADPDHWALHELELIRTLVTQVRARYTIDADRVVAAGEKEGGTLACLAALQVADVFSGAAAIDARIGGRAVENEPDHRLAFYVARPGKGRTARDADEAVTSLRSLKFPVTVKDLGENPRPLSDDELAELVRWIDTLDRI
jgi:serine protease Do